MTSSSRRRLLLVTTAAFALAAPACAVAATPTLSASVKGPKGYTLTVSASQFSGGGQRTVNSVLVDADRTLKRSFQDHSLGTNAHTSYTANGKLTKAKLKAAFGTYGSVKLKFTGTGKVKKSLPKRCHGTAAKTRKGILKGTLKVRFKKGGGYIRRFRLKGTLATAGRFTCTFPPTRASHAYTLNTFSRSASAPSFFATRTIARKVAMESASLTRTVHGVTVSNLISATKTGASYLQPNADLSKATLKGIGPWLKGTLHYTGSPAGPTSSTGSYTGSLKAKFDFIGTKTIKPKQGTLAKF
jgi:hypothetical protein